MKTERKEYERKVQYYIDVINAYVLGGIASNVLHLTENQVNRIYTRFVECGYSLNDTSNIAENDYDHIVLNLAKEFA